MNISASTLFHYTKSLDILFKIMSEGFWPRYCSEPDLHPADKDKDEWIPMVCFTDIPVTQIASNPLWKGKYGIGLDKDWIIRNQKAVPVLYFYEGSAPIFNRLTKAATQEDSTEEIRRNLLCILKRYSNADGSTIYYNEREWRYIPKLSDPKKLIQVRKKGVQIEESLNEEVKRTSSLTFPIDAINYLIVEKETDVDKLVAQIDDLYKTEPLCKRARLYTRIFTMEQLNKDF